MDGENVKIFIPGWDADQEVNFPIEGLPKEVREKVELGWLPLVVLLQCVLDADAAENLEIGDIEIAPEPVSEEELLSDS